MDSNNQSNLLNKLEAFQETLTDKKEIQFIEYYKTIVRYYEQDPEILNKIRSILGNM